jgi:hypothetical protein
MQVFKVYNIYEKAIEKSCSKEVGTIFKHSYIACFICMASINGTVLHQLYRICAGRSGYIYPVNTSNAVFQTPLNNSGVAPGTNQPNAMGYSGAKFYLISNTTSSTNTFTSYNGVSTYNTGLASAFTSSTYPVMGTGTSDGLGYYSIDWNGYLWYYKISTNTWTRLVQRLLTDQVTILQTSLKTHYIMEIWWKMAGAVCGS